jgi:hypothetical protein
MIRPPYRRFHSPGALEEFHAAEVLFADAFLAHGFDDLGFGRNRAWSVPGSQSAA